VWKEYLYLKDDFESAVQRLSKMEEDPDVLNLFVEERKEIQSKRLDVRDLRRPMELYSTAVAKAH
jgi:hypothetical protein